MVPGDGRAPAKARRSPDRSRDGPRALNESSRIVSEASTPFVGTDWPEGPKTPEWPGTTLGAVVFYAVVSDEIDQVIEFFVDREDAETMLARVLVGEPEWEDSMRVEPVELATGGLN
jgi:hypothetical protein